MASTRPCQNRQGSAPLLKKASLVRLANKNGHGFLSIPYFAKRNAFLLKSGRERGGNTAVRSVNGKEGTFHCVQRLPPMQKFPRVGLWSYYVCAQSPTLSFSSFPYSTRKGFFMKGTLVGRTILCPSSEYESKRIGDDPHFPPLYGAPSLLFLHRIQGGGPCVVDSLLSSPSQKHDICGLSALLRGGGGGETLPLFPLLVPLPSIHMLIFATLDKKVPPHPAAFPSPFCWGDFF